MGRGWGWGGRWETGRRGGGALGPGPRAGRSSHPTPHPVFPVMEEGLAGSPQSCLLVSPFPSGPSVPPTGPAVPAAPVQLLLQVASRGPVALGWAGWASMPSWLCPSGQGANAQAQGPHREQERPPAKGEWDCGR